MTDVFISYKREERPRCVAIYNALVDLKLAVWFDAHIEPGTDFDREIEREVRRAHAVLVLWSALAADSDWIRAEARTGRQNERLVAARLDDCLPPLEFASVQAVDLFGSGDFRTGEGWRQIVTRIGRLASRPGLGDYVRCEQAADAGLWRGWIAANPGDPLVDRARQRLAALGARPNEGALPDLGAPAVAGDDHQPPPAVPFIRRPLAIGLAVAGALLLILAVAKPWSGAVPNIPSASSPAAPAVEVSSGPPPAVIADITESFVPKDMGMVACNTGPYPIAFDSGMANITPDSLAMLDMLGKVARDCGGKVDIVAPNDRMAAVVQNYLEGRGVAPRNLSRRASGDTGSQVKITLR